MIDYEFDAMGNRIHVKADYNDALGGNRQIQDYWYAYDKMAISAVAAVWL